MIPILLILPLAPVVGLPGGAQARSDTVPDRLVKEASAVKDRHVAALFRLPAVVGVGVGACKQSPGKPAIVVYLARTLTEKERRAFPPELEGIPVELHESGPFVALQARPAEFSLIPIELDKPATRPRARVITSEQEWQKFLQEFQGRPDSPAPIDFRRDTAVAIFAGEKPTGGYSVRINRVTGESEPAKPSRGTVHYDIVAPPPDALVTQALTYPYAVLRVAKRFDRLEFQPAISKPGDR